MNPFRRLDKRDWIVILSGFIFVGAHMVTKAVSYMLINIVQSAQASQALIKTIETNPIAAILLTSGNASYLLIYSIIPTFLFASYYGIRRLPYIRDNPVVLNILVVGIFLVALTNFLNDISAMIGLMLR